MSEAVTTELSDAFDPDCLHCWFRRAIGEFRSGAPVGATEVIEACATLCMEVVVSAPDLERRARGVAYIRRCIDGILAALIAEGAAGARGRGSAH